MNAVESKIQIEDLSFVYGKGTSFEKVAIENMSLSIQPGDFVGVIGPVGSGKSTFVRNLNGLLRPTQGRVLLDGQDIWAEPKKIKNHRFKVGLVFQYPEHQLFEETVYKDIAFGPRNMGLSESQIKECVYMALSFVNLSEKILEKSPFELSGGEKRRVAIAGVIAMNPEVLVLDEPTASLDPKGRKELLHSICEYHRCQEKTIIIVSHNMDDVARITNKVLVMADGKSVMFDETRTVFERGKLLEEMGLRVPDTVKLMLLLKKKGLNVNCGVLNVIEAMNEIERLFLERGQGLDK